MIRFEQKGDFKKTTSFLKSMKERRFLSKLDRYGKEGVVALSSATPVNTGKTAASWYYEIEKTENSYSIVWKNSNVNNGVLIAVLIQYGHGTGWGGYVQGRDYINPAMRPIFDNIAESAWREVENS